MADSLVSCILYYGYNTIILRHFIEKKRYFEYRERNDSKSDSNAKFVYFSKNGYEIIVTILSLTFAKSAKVNLCSSNFIINN